MQSKILKQNNSNKLILFFNGWSLDENIVNNLTSSNYDVIMFCDYSDLKIDKNTLKEINNYEEINIIAWSFGVWACSCVADKFKNLKNAIAINGTPMPIDNNFGIPEKIFNLTLSNLSEKNYVRFFKNMFKDKADLSKSPKRDIENQRHELIEIKNNSVSQTIHPTSFTKVFVGMQDKIIPAKNQLKFWKENTNLIKTDYGHYIPFKNWDEIING